jgi:predicted  nucleic acid-binding Zn-ribbon protein
MLENLLYLILGQFVALLALIFIAVERFWRMNSLLKSVEKEQSQHLTYITTLKEQVSDMRTNHALVKQRVSNVETAWDKIEKQLQEISGKIDTINEIVITYKNIARENK